MSEENQQDGNKKQDRPDLGVDFEDAVPARVQEISGRVGMSGEAQQVKCKVLEGRDEDKVIRRNVKGPVREGDIIMLTETEIEAQSLQGGR